MASSSLALRQERISRKVQGQARRVFKTDYRLLRAAGLTRKQAVDLCLRRVSENRDNLY